MACNGEDEMKKRPAGSPGWLTGAARWLSSPDCQFRDSSKF
jgi:hypothetical protein